MRNIILLVASILVIAAVIFCGKDKEGNTQQQAAEQVQDQELAQENESHNPAEMSEPQKDQMTVRNPNMPEVPAPANDTVPMGPEIPPDELQEGTCEYAAYWFAEYFTSGDSLKAYELCTDSMKNVVRTILQSPGQMKNMELNRAAGYELVSAAKAVESSGDYCRACLRASFMNAERQQCDFHFTRVNGKWLLSAFKKE